MTSLKFLQLQSLAECTLEAAVPITPEVLMEVSRQEESMTVVEVARHEFAAGTE